MCIIYKIRACKILILDTSLLCVFLGVCLKYFSFAFLLLFIISCSPTYNYEPVLLSKNKVSKISVSQVTKSFVKLHIKILATMECPEGIECDEVSIDAGSVVGSGTVIKKSMSGMKVLTAAHVCSPEDYSPTIKSFEKYGARIDKKIIAMNFFGSVANFEIEKIDKDIDICVLKTRSIWEFTPTIKISKSKPKRGQKIYIMGAPHGIFWPGTVLFFDGYYVGLDHGANAVYTIPAKPGTSGGGVLNEKGELIGVIHSGLTNMETVGFGTNYEITKDFTKYLNKGSIF